ncbi:MAG: permease prefix domain 1-containing protein [Candidatus Izimaplasma sp.]|nr:permease prefix domain 1-containing protein [Candidatus Izimaplasma bacterium]
MKNKIINYVNYQFRFDEREDIEEIKQEIIANLIDRYQDLRKEGLEEEPAYIEAIKHMGDITETKETKVDEIYQEKPSWSLIAMVTVTILAVSAVLISLFSSFIGLLVTILSITFFGTASYNLYATSQYKRAEYLDIDKQKTNLNTIMKYFRTNYLPWSISFSISLTGLCLQVMFLLTAESLTTIVSQGIFQFIIVVFIIGLIIFLTLILLFKNIEKKLYKRYKFITGETVPSSIYHSFMPKTSTFSWHLVFFVIMSFILWILPVYYANMNSPLIVSLYTLVGLWIPFLINIGAGIYLIKTHKHNSKVTRYLIILGVLFSYFLVGLVYDMSTNSNFASVLNISLLFIVITSIVYFVNFRKDKNKEKAS